MIVIIKRMKDYFMELKKMGDIFSPMKKLIKKKKLIILITQGILMLDMKQEISLFL